MGSDSRARAVCQEALAALAGETGQQAELFDEPDKSERMAKAVDFLACTSDLEYAIEHTRIESYPGQMEDWARLSRLFDPLIERADLKGELPEGQFVIVTDPHAVAGLKRTAEAREAVFDWVLKTAPGLAIGSSGTKPNHFATGPPELHFALSLYRWPSTKIGPRLAVIQNRPEDLQVLRSQRIRKAVNDKCPKLEAAREGLRHTMLVLEDQDLALSNHVAVSSALRVAFEEAPHLARPDHIFWVDAWNESYLAEQVDLDISQRS